MNWNLKSVQINSYLIENEASTKKQHTVMILRFNPEEEIRNRFDYSVYKNFKIEFNFFLINNRIYKQNIIYTHKM